MSALLTKAEAKSAEDTATMYLCGATPASCRAKQVPSLVKKLVFDFEMSVVWVS